MTEGFDALAALLRRIDGKSYRAYKDLTGRGYADRHLDLHVDHVQGDPFAPPSRLRAFVPHDVADFDPALYATSAGRDALADLVARRFARAARRHGGGGRGSGKSGRIEIDAPGQEVLARSACTLDDTGITLRFSVGLPAAGRRVLGREAVRLLVEDLPEVIRDATFAPDPDPQAERLVAAVTRQRHLRAQLRDRGLVAFIADGARLPRRSGVDPRPLEGDSVVPFASPAALRVTLDTPEGPPFSGLGIPVGVTLIVGGGYHGKSTLLSAIDRGIYDHIPTDGRDACVSDPATVKIRAEDGRRVAGVDISGFIDNLPGGRDTRAFFSDDASGSTSQAAAVWEAVEVGARVLLIDEDTAATNFMIRDERMQRLIAPEREPITPFVDRVRALYDDHGVSTVLVVGGSGDYFDVADTVIALDAYVPRDVTSEARAIAAERPTGRRSDARGPLPACRHRAPRQGCIDPSKGKRDVQVTPRGRQALELGRERIDLSAVAGLVTGSQLQTIGRALWRLGRSADGETTILELLERLEASFAAEGWAHFDPAARHDLAAVRRFEIAAALNRLRTLDVG
ncbi:MAG: ABC-ATPase domain-containing protein [Myxococcota bacterium]